MSYNQSTAEKIPTCRSSSGYTILTTWLGTSVLYSRGHVYDKHVTTTKPLQFSQLWHFLAKKVYYSEFKIGSSEVHAIFDTPGQLENTPKYYELKFRDSKAAIAVGHVYADLTGSTSISGKKWRENYLNCRNAKEN